jgi:hypothetical protein
MLRCSQNLRYRAFMVCKIIMFKVKKKFFSTMSERGNSVLEAKKIIFGCRYGLPYFIFLFLVELGTCVQNAEIHLQRSFFENKNSIWTILRLKIQMVETCSSASSTCRNFYFWKTLKSRFLVVFQSFVFGQILANFGQFWADLDRFSCIHSG